MLPSGFEALPAAFLVAVEALLPPAQRLHPLADRLVYERDTNYLHAQLPALVCLPHSTQAVQALVRLCLQHGIPYTARGAGTGESAGAVPLAGGIVISLAAMTRCLGIEAAAGTVRVEAGLVNGRLNELLAPLGFQYRPDPSSQKACTLGGNWAENAGGLHCVKYGVTSDHVLSLQWVMPSGEVVETQPTQARFQEGVWDITPLLVGSEGGLGILTEATLRLSPLPAATAVVQLSFATMAQACDAVSRIMATASPPPAALEIMDALTIQCVNKAFGVGLPNEAQAVLLLEVDGGSLADIAAQLAALRPVWEGFAPLSVEEATTSERIAALWQARRGAAASYGQLAKALYVLDPVVPRPAVATVLAGIDALAQLWGIPVANVFHAGDGNLHPHLFFDPKDPAAREKVEGLAVAIMQLCIQHGGVISGEHGIGLEKIGLMTAQFSEADLAPMRWLQSLIDPAGLANPNKQLPNKRFCSEGGCHGHGDASSSLRGLSPQWLEATGLWI